MKRHDPNRRPEPLSEYLEADEVNALIRAAPNSRARLLFLVQWRAGLRVFEGLALEVRDLSLDSGLPMIHVRRGNGSKPRMVPVPPICASYGRRWSRRPSLLILGIMQTS